MRDHYADSDHKNTVQLRSVLKELPNFCIQFFRGIEPRTTVLTRLGYAGDLKIFFRFLSEELVKFGGTEPIAFTVQDMAKLEPVDLEIYLEYLSYYIVDDREFSNKAAAKERKLSAIRTLFHYLLKRELIPANITPLVDLPKKHEKPIVRLEPNEVASLLDMAETGEGLTERQKKFQAKTRLRDIAMLTLFLSTGIRVSECVGINIDDIDFSINGFAVTRKGGDRVILYFPEETSIYLKPYLEQRLKISAVPGHEKALFLSMQRKRINVRSVENLVKKYARVAVPLKKISPHKLRSTFGTALYQETGDIYLVADVLGHNDVNTTRKHYAAMSDEKRRMAAQMIKLRDEEDQS